MSADNVLLLVEQEDGRFFGYDCSMSMYIEDEDFVPSGTPEFVALDLRGAIQVANYEMSQSVVEYGYRVLLRE